MRGLLSPGATCALQLVARLFVTGLRPLEQKLTISLEAPIKEPSPQALADRLSEVGAEIWSMALQLANARLAADREALETDRAQMEADRQEAADLADQLNATSAARDRLQPDHRGCSLRSPDGSMERGG